jgi:8-oxo-dGTP diphosphatase
MSDEKDLYNVSLKLLLKNEKGEVLALKADPNGTLAGFYDLPGGRINKDEFYTPMMDILMREVHEEIGDVNVTISPKPIGVGRHIVQKDPEIHIFIVLFEAQITGGEIIISSEHSGKVWVDLLKEDPKKYFTSGHLQAIEMYFNSK